MVPGKFLYAGGKSAALTPSDMRVKYRDQVIRAFNGRPTWLDPVIGVFL